MTFCIAMKVEEGLVGLADTRLTTGAERITARKVSIHQHGHHSMFVMTSGLRSVRDKALTYFQDVIEDSDETFNKLYKAVNAFAEQIRRVAKEDKKPLQEAGFSFNLHAIVGGQLEADADHKLYLIYPQGNWVEVSQGTPYYVIGESAYGKPLLDRCLTYKTSLAQAVKLGYLAFDATRTAATDVGFPLDVVLYRAGGFRIVEHRYEEKDLIHISEWWQTKLRERVDDLPDEWIKDALNKLGDSG